MLMAHRTIQVPQITPQLPDFLAHVARLPQPSEICKEKKVEVKMGKRKYEATIFILQASSQLNQSLKRVNVISKALEK